MANANNNQTANNMALVQRPVWPVWMMQMTKPRVRMSEKGTFWHGMVVAHCAVSEPLYTWPDPGCTKNGPRKRKYSVSCKWFVGSRVEWLYWFNWHLLNLKCTKFWGPVYCLINPFWVWTMCTPFWPQCAMTSFDGHFQQNTTPRGTRRYIQPWEQVGPYRKMHI